MKTAKNSTAKPANGKSVSSKKRSEKRQPARSGLPASSPGKGNAPRATNGPARPRTAAPELESESPRWTFFTNHAHVLICLYQDSEAILREIATRVGITERAVQRIVQELEEAGFVKRDRVGRRNRYTVSHNKSLRHPIEEHCSVDELFAVILDKQQSAGG